MSIYEYEEGREIAVKDLPFYPLIQAAMRKADTCNLELLKEGWPEIWRELRSRYNAPGSKLQSELKGDKQTK